MHLVMTVKELSELVERGGWVQTDSGPVAFSPDDVVYLDPDAVVFDYEPTHPDGSPLADYLFGPEIISVAEALKWTP